MCLPFCCCCCLLFAFFLNNLFPNSIKCHSKLASCLARQLIFNTTTETELLWICMSLSCLSCLWRDIYSMFYSATQGFATLWYTCRKKHLTYSLSIRFMLWARTRLCLVKAHDFPLLLFVAMEIYWIDVWNGSRIEMCAVQCHVRPFPISRTKKGKRKKGFFATDPFTNFGALKSVNRRLKAT